MNVGLMLKYKNIFKFFFRKKKNVSEIYQRFVLFEKHKQIIDKLYPVCKIHGFPVFCGEKLSTDRWIWFVLVEAYDEQHRDEYYICTTFEAESVKHDSYVRQLICEAIDKHKELLKNFTYISD